MYTVSPRTVLIQIVLIQIVQSYFCERKYSNSALFCISKSSNGADFSTLNGMDSQSADSYSAPFFGTKMHTFQGLTVPS